MAKCFVIQPFDRDVFDSRYKDTFKPAIEEAGYEPYRVDEDPSVSIPIEQIEKGIREAAVCFAEITTDNANIWYELGYAFAARKAVVMVCERNARQKFPFDVQHRNITLYDTRAVSDFETLKAQIIARLKAIDKTEIAVKELSKENPLTDLRGLSAFERIVLTAIIGNLLDEANAVYETIIINEANRSGLTNAAIVLALRNLTRKGFIERAVHTQYRDGTRYTIYAMTDVGWNWVMANEDQFTLQHPRETDLHL